MFRRFYSFGDESSTANVIGVTASDLYLPLKGYGFVTEENRKEQEQLNIPELNSAFDPFYWYRDESLMILQDGDGCVYLDSDAKIHELEATANETFVGEYRFIPLCFKADVPRQGNYKVTITLHSEEELGEVLIYTGRRRLAFRGEIHAGEAFSHTCLINVCDIVPRGQTRVYTDKSVDITIVARKPMISTLTVVETPSPTIYIAGDSTVTDQGANYPYSPGTSYSGWGQMLSAWLDDKIAVSNHSHSGLTTDSFRQEGHYSIVESFSRARDYIFFQFGHNDQKLDELKADGGYRLNLLRFVSEARLRGQYPVIVTPIARNSWKNPEEYNDLLKEYAEVCFEVGRVADVPVLDLHGISMEFIKKTGLEASKKFFYPGDFTHSNDYGAYLFAGVIASEIKRVCSKHSDYGYHLLAKHVTKGFGDWDITEDIVVPKRPAIYEDVKNPNEETEFLSEYDRLEQKATRADVLDMIIKLVKFFPTNVYNDMFKDVVGHEWYAGIVECAWQNGIIDDSTRDGDYFYPEGPVTLMDFCIFAMNGYGSRWTLPEIAVSPYDALVKDKPESVLKNIRAAYACGILASGGEDSLSKRLTRGEAVQLCRVLQSKAT